MPSLTRVLAVSALLAMANGQAILISAKGNSGESKALQLKANDAKDAQIINDEEIVANIVNECGRTLLNGNIDIGQNTEDALAAKQVTTVTKGSKVTATFNVNDQGAGPFTCDLDQTSNANGVTGQTVLKTKESAVQNGQLTITMTMPSNMTLIGGSTGNIGTVRCRNKLNFGSCFAVQQTDVTANKNTPENVAAAKTLQEVLDLVAQNVKDFPDVAAASARAKDESEQGTNAIDALLKNNPQIKQAANATAVTGAKTGNNNNGKANTGKANGTGKKGNNNNAGAAANSGANSGNRAQRAKNNNNNKNRRRGAPVILARNPVNKRELQAARRMVAEAAIRWAKRVIEEEDQFLN